MYNSSVYGLIQGRQICRRRMRKKMRKKILMFVFVMATGIYMCSAESSNGTIKAQQSTKSIKALFNEVGRTNDSNIKTKLLNELKVKKPTTVEDTESVILALDNSDLDIQDAAVEILYNIREKRASKKLLEKIKGLPIKKAEKLSAQQEEDYKIRSKAALVLSEMKNKDALPIIIDKLGEASSSAGYDEQLLYISAVNYGKDTVPLIKKRIKKIDRKNPYGKMRLLTIIAKLKDKEGAGYLKDLYKDNDTVIKTFAARGLRNIGEKIEVSDLIKTLKGHERNYKNGKEWLEAKCQLVDEIGYTGNSDAIPFLKERIEKSKSYSSCYGELLALARIGGHGNYLYLKNIYDNSKDYDSKSRIVNVFGEGKMTEAIPFLEDIMNNKNMDKQMRLYCSYSLGKITGRDYWKISWEITEGKR
jgi:HEAT repeat protein